MERRFYSLLGVGHDDCASGISNAFNDLNRHLHPERGGRQGTPQYRRTLLAYSVLADRGERNRYDALDEGEGGYGAESRLPAASLGAFRLSMHEDFEAPETERLRVDNVIRDNFERDSLPKSGRVECLDLLVEVPPRTAIPTVELGVPVYHPCVTCHGSGHVYAQPCPACDAAGVQAAEEWLAVCPTDMEQSEVSLVGLGIRNLRLRLHWVVTQRP